MTYMHEHLRIDLSAGKGDPDYCLDQFNNIVDELFVLAGKGLKRIVDMSCRGMGRNYNYLDRMEKLTGIKILVSTGYFKDPFMPPEVNKSSEKELAEIMIGDIEKGAEGSRRKARIIGKIGTSQNIMTPNEEKVFRAAAMAHEKTGVYISTHTTLGTMGWEQIYLLKSHGVNTEKIIIGHLDLADSEELILRVLDEGVYIEFDTIGKTKYISDEKRVDFIKTCCGRGYSRQLLLSMDIKRRSELKANGGIGYAYLLDSFLPMLREAGITDEAIADMLIDNPNKIFKEVS